MIYNYKNTSFLFLSKIHYSLLLISLVISSGIIGFHFFLGYGIVDAVYMTVITIATVGFEEVQPLDDRGKIFVIFLIISSIGTFTYSISNITNFIINGDFIKNYKYSKMISKIKKLKGHTILCGIGKTGLETYRRLHSYKKQVVIIEKNEAKKNDILSDDKNIFFITGDALDDDTLDLVNIQEAHSIISTFPSDSDNLLLVLSSRQKNKDITIISRASNHNTVSKLKFAGADNIIMPDILGGNRMASLVISTDIVEFLDKLITNVDSFNISEINVETLPSNMINKSLKDLDIKQKTNCHVIGIKNPNNEYTINPSSNTIITENMRLIVIGSEEEIKVLNSLFNS